MDEAVARELIEALNRNTEAQLDTKAVLDEILAKLGSGMGASFPGIPRAAHGTSLVPARCTSCGASLEVDPEQKAAVCPYCNQPYIVDQAINNVNVDLTGDMNIASANITVTGVDASNMKARGHQYKDSCEWDKAIEYFEKALDIDAQDQEAIDGIEAVKKARHNYIFHSEKNVMRGFMEYGTLQLKEARLIYIPDKKPEQKTVYSFSKIISLQIDRGYLFIELTGRDYLRALVNNPDRWLDLIKRAIDGKYPQAGSK